MAAKRGGGGRLHGVSFGRRFLASVWRVEGNVAEAQEAESLAGGRVLYGWQGRGENAKGKPP